MSTKKSEICAISVNTNLPEERPSILRIEEELKNLPDNSTNIFKRNTLNRYMHRPNHSFCQGRHSMLDSFYFAEFVYKPKEVDWNEDYQLDALPDSLIEGNHNCCNYPKIIKFINSNEKMRCCKVRRVFRYHTPNKHHYP